MNDLPTIEDPGMFDTNRGGGDARLETAEAVGRYRVERCRRREFRIIDLQQFNGRIVGVADAITRDMGVYSISCCRCWMEVLDVKLII